MWNFSCRLMNAGHFSLCQLKADASVWAERRATLPTHCWQCRGDRWLTAGHSWRSGRSCLWPEKAAGPGPRVGRRRGCLSWWRTSVRAWTASSGYTGSGAEERTKKFYFRNPAREGIREKCLGFFMTLSTRVVFIPLANFAFYKIWLRFVI